MPSLLRLSDLAWPCSRADLERDNPATWFPPDLADAQPLADFGYALPLPTDPPTCNPATHRAEEIAPVNVDGQWHQAWQLIELPPAPPAPPVADWGSFKSGLLTSADVAQVMAAARASGCEPAVSALPVTLEAAQSGRPAEFAACWALVVAAGGASPEALAALAASAQACNLPADFVQALQPLVRARNADGTYAADDPTTPQNEAWSLPE